MLGAEDAQGVKSKASLLSKGLRELTQTAREARQRVTQRALSALRGDTVTRGLGQAGRMQAHTHARGHCTQAHPKPWVEDLLSPLHG